MAEEAQASLDLSSGPLLRAVGMDLSDGSQRLLVVIHHLVVDGVSWRVLLEDLALAYEQLGSGGEVHLPAKSQSYASWGARLRAHAEQLGGELDYWLARSSSGDLPCDRAHDGIDRVADAEEVSLVLDKRVTDAAAAAGAAGVSDAGERPVAGGSLARAVALERPR